MSTNEKTSTPAAEGAPPAAPALSRSTALNAKVAISFLSRDSDAALLVAVGLILARMTDNPVYPSPGPALADIATALDLYDSAVSAAKDGGRTAVLARRQARDTLVALMKKLALYVQKTCDGDPVKLAGSGFTAQRGRGPKPPLPPAPRTLRLSKGRLAEQLVARCARVPDAVAYQYRYANAATPATWTVSDFVARTSFVLEDLVPGTTYTTQVRAFNHSGGSDWSDGATLMAG